MFKFLKPFSIKKDYVLVISWWGARAAYALGVLQGLEELGMKDDIKAIYGVSAWAIVWAYWAAGYRAWDIYERFVDMFSFGVSKINFLPKKSLLKSDFLKKTFVQDLPPQFEQLKVPLYIWATDANTAEYQLFSSRDILPPLLGSMSIPGIFPPISFQNMQLVDGGTINNFPVDLAKEAYPKHKIIGIALNKFHNNQKLSTIFDTLLVGFDLLLKAQVVNKFDLVDHLFYKDLGVKVLDTKEKDMRRIFQQGHEDCLEHFGR